MSELLIKRLNDPQQIDVGGRAKRPHFSLTGKADLVGVVIFTYVLVEALKLVLAADDPRYLLVYLHKEHAS